MGWSTRQDGCTCPKTVMEHELGCPVVPFISLDELEKIRGPLAGTSGPADGTAGAVPLTVDHRQRKDKTPAAERMQEALSS
jgi:hypothetical protein